MSDQKWKSFPGKWPCKKCEEVVPTLRLWLETGDATWMCSKRHISKVGLIPPKKTKKDFKNE